MRPRSWFIVLLGFFLLFALVTCDDDTTPPIEAGTDAPPDSVVYPDQLPPDSFVWPDQGQDQIIWPDMYTGTPFGCQSDSDCFGRKCCATPWGVKLCASTCD